MKITEWENLLNKKYKVLSKITNPQDLEAYLNFKSNLLYVLKLDDVIVYVNGNDNLITGVFSNEDNINREIANVLNIPYFIDLLNKNHIISQEDIINYLLAKGFSKLKLDDIPTEYLDYYYHKTKLTIESLTEGCIEDKDFLAAYILDDKSIYGSDFEVSNDSRYFNTMIFIESKDKINVTNTFVHSAGFSSIQKYEEFLKYINIEEYESNGFKK